MLLMFSTLMFQNSFKGTPENISSFADMYVVFPQRDADSLFSTVSLSSVTKTFTVHL